MTEANSEESLSGFRVAAFFAADHAVVENGKLYVNGGFFDRVYYPVFPAPISTLAVVGLIEVPPEQFQRDHTYTIRMEEASSTKPIVKIEGGFRVVPAPDSEPGDPSKVAIAVPLTGFSLPRAGDYWFVLSVNDSELAHYRVRAAQVGVVAQMLPRTPTGDSVEQQEE
jgi:hypothetical protein